MPASPAEGGQAWHAGMPALVSVAMGLLALLLQSHWSPQHAGKPAWALQVEAGTATAQLNLTQLREESMGMFHWGWSNYMRHAFPKDDLRPLSCRGKNSQGGIGLTLIDALDTLLVMDDLPSFQHAVRWLAANATFHLDARVHVFELTIRALGGLLSSHMLVTSEPRLLPEYDGTLLRLAVDLTDRLLPAFDTPSGVPLSWVNLAKGQIPGDVRSTCTACAGTLLLEFGVLSRLTGNATYEAKARQAVETIYGMRSSRGLVGNTLDCDSGAWLRTDAGVGAGVDSFYEYLLKAYLAFGDEAFLSMFADMYSAAIVNLQLSHAVNGFVWLIDAHMEGGHLLHPYVWSLGAFWPGLQALAGQVEEGLALHANWTSAFKRFGWLPEMFDIQLESRHPTEGGYPLRPELMESTFLLYAATHDPRLMKTGAVLHGRLRDKNRAVCGYASVGDVSTGQLEDTMESFFLSETVKYLYLLFSNATALVDHFVLSTEGHFFPPFESTAANNSKLAPANLTAAADALPLGSAATPAAPDAAMAAESGLEHESAGEAGAGKRDRQPGRAAGGASGGADATELAPDDGEGQGETADLQWRRALGAHVKEKCRPLCEADARQAAAAADVLASALPLVPLRPSWAALLRARRCRACQRVTRAVATAKHRRAQALASAVPKAGAAAGVLAGRHPEHQLPGVSVSGVPLLRQFLCHIADTKPGRLGCARIQEIPPINLAAHTLQALSNNVVVLQLTEGVADQKAKAAVEVEDEDEDDEWEDDEEEEEEEDDGMAEQKLQQPVGGGSLSQRAGPEAGLEQQEVPYLQAVAVDVRLANGSTATLHSVLAEFGPGFLPSCPVSSQCTERSSGISRTGGGDDGAASTAATGSSNSSSTVATCTAQGAEACAARSGADACAAGVGDGLQGGGCSACSSLQEHQQPQQLHPQPDEPSTHPHAGVSCSSSTSSAAANEDGASSPFCCIEGDMLAAEPLDGCGPLANAAAAVGKVVLVQRGRCPFVDKALHCQEAGALAAVVVNTQPAVMVMGGDGGNSQPAVPAVMVSDADGRYLLTAAASGQAPVLRLHAAAEHVQRELEAHMQAAMDQEAGGQCLSTAAAAAETAEQAAASMAGRASAGAAAADAAARVAPAGGGHRKKQSLVEMLVPPSTQPWLVQQIMLKKDLGGIFDMLIARLMREMEEEVAPKVAGSASSSPHSSSGDAGAS